MLAALGSAPTAARADAVITDFNSASLGSYNPREAWFAFGTGTTDSGVHADGANGRGAYHSVNWAGSTWGIGEVSTVTVDLSGFDALRVRARVVDQAGHTGTALLRFALDLPGATEWSTPTVPLSDAYQTCTFDFSAMTRVAGSGPLDLSAGKPKFIVEKSGQSGAARFDFDEVVGVTGAAEPYVLVPVVLHPPPDGDAARAMWLYAFADNLRVDDAAQSQAILDYCAQEGVNEIFFGAFNVWSGAPALRDNLRAFLQTAHASGVHVEALIDGVGEFQDPAFIRTRIDEVLALHNQTPGDSSDDFDAIHFDIEFWLSSAWAAAANEAQRQTLAREFLDNVLINARNHMDASGAADVEVGVDLSSHFDTSGMLPSPMNHGGVTQLFVEHVLDRADSVVLMSYIDFAGGLLDWTDAELDMAAGKRRAILLGADIQPVPPEVSINSYADNFTPTPFAAMTTTLEAFHEVLTPQRLSAFRGFSVFHYDGYAGQSPIPRNVADFNGDGEVDPVDLDLLLSYLSGPGVAPPRVGLDADYDRTGAVDMADLARFQTCYTGPDCGCPVPEVCQR